MGFLEKLQFKFWDAKGMVNSFINEWEPQNCKNEKAYEKSLYSFLHEKFQDIQITKQFSRGRIKADIVVGDKVILELKNNLNTTAKYQRLIGQLSEYKEWEGHIIILLTGTTDPNLKKQLINFLEKEGLKDDFDYKVSIVEK